MYYNERYDVTVTSINSGIWTSPKKRSLLVVRYWLLLRVLVARAHSTNFPLPKNQTVKYESLGNLPL